MTTSISREELRSAINEGAVTVVDALPAAPYSRRHLPGAVNLVEDEIEHKASELLPQKSASIVTYSTDAARGRGEALAKALESIGFTDVRTYRDGIEDWVGAGLPLEPDRPAGQPSKTDAIGGLL